MRTFPLSTGEFSSEQEVVPLTRKEKKSRAGEKEERPEIKDKSIKLPASEVKRQQTKRHREKGKKKRKAKEERLKSLKREGKEKMRREKRLRRKRRRRKRNKRRKRGLQALRRAKVFLRSPFTHPEAQGMLNRLELPEKHAWSNDLVVDSQASDSTLPLAVLPGSHWRGQRTQGNFIGRR